MKRINEALGSPISKENALFAGGAALFFVGVTTVLNHREKTHHSLKAKPLMEGVSRFAMWLLGTVPRHWGRVHISHHAARDANLLNILETADGLEWLDSHPEVKAAVPEKFHGLDPVTPLTPAQIKAIGASARKQVQDRYERPETYSSKELERLLDPTTRRYLYPHKSEISKAPQIRAGDKSIQRLYSVLVDPHSPPLHILGVLGMLRDNVPNYRANQEDVRAFEEIGEYDLGRDNKDKKFFDKSKWGLGVFFGFNILFQAARRRELSTKALGQAALSGSLVGGAIGQGLKIAGNITNGLGHAGRSIVEALLKGRPLPNMDGTFTYNAKSFNLFTLDEVGGQKNHHEKPWQVAYTDSTGIRKFVEAPFGTVIDGLAQRNILFEAGDAFGHPEIAEANEVFTLESKRDFVRPDEPMEAVLMLEAVRSRFLHDTAA